MLQQHQRLLLEPHLTPILGVLGTNSSETNLGAGGYSLVVTDANSCTVTASFIVNNTSPNISISSSSASCGSSNGSALVSAVGGTIPYTIIGQAVALLILNLTYLVVIIRLQLPMRQTVCRSKPLP